MIDPADWAKLKDLFGEAIDAPPDTVAEVLARADGYGPEFGKELRELLQAHHDPQLNTGGLRRVTPRHVEAMPASGPADGRIGPYRVLREIGRGGTGVVFLAERADDEFHRQVAIKVLRYVAWDDRSRDLLRRERQMLAQLQHPNIAALIDWGETEDGSQWLATEYVEGVEVDVFCRDRQLDVDATLGVFEQMCQAVQYAHRQLVVHRDLKPGNIIVSTSGIVKLLDFGISKPIHDQAITSQFDRRYTPAYASPEQIRGEAMSAASDVYALGLILYQLLAGFVPHASGSMRDIARRLEDFPLPRPSDAADLPWITPSEIRGDLDSIVLHALERQPNRRYASVEQMLADVERYREGFPVLAEAATPWRRASKFLHRNTLSVSLVSIAIVAMVLGTVASLSSARAAKAEQALAERRFVDLQQFAHSVIFDIHDEIRLVPGSVAARRKLIATAVKYLDDLNAQHINDDNLQLELAAAYIRMAYTQGGVAGVNLGLTGGAMKNYRSVLAILDDQWQQHPDDEKVGALRFPAAYNLALMINDPKESREFAQRYSTDADLWQLHNAGTGPMQTSYLLHIALGRANRLEGRLDESLEQFDIAERMRAAMMPRTDTTKEMRPMFGIWVDRGQGLLDGGLIASGRSETLIQMDRVSDALAAAEQAQAFFDASTVISGRQPSNQRMLARTPALRAEILSRLGREKEAWPLAESAVALATAATADGSGTSRRDLGVAEDGAAAVARRAGRIDHALDYEARAIAEFDALVAADANLVLDRYLLANALNNQGDALWIARKQTDAVAAYRRAGDIAAKAQVDAPTWAAIRDESHRATAGAARQ